MTLPEQSDRAVAQAREFLVRLTSPYVEGGIKGIRREVRAEASRMLRHYPYAKVDEKRGVDDTSGATDIVTRLRNWRTVHLARLHLLMQEAADEMERLSRGSDCPESDNAANGDTVGRTLARRITGLQSTLEVAKLQEEVRRLEGVIAARDAAEADEERFSLCSETWAIGEKPTVPTLTDEEREAVSWCVEMALHSATDCVAEVRTLRGLLERL
jgi:hypothetical protein